MQKSDSSTTDGRLCLSGASARNAGSLARRWGIEGSSAFSFLHGASLLEDLVECAVCASFENCKFDNNAIFDHQWVSSEISTADYIHLNVTGQANLAALSTLRATGGSHLHGAHGPRPAAARGHVSRRADLGPSARGPIKRVRTSA